VAAGEDPDGSRQAALVAAPERARPALDEVIVDLLDKVRGEPAEQLAAVLLAHGAVDRAPHDLQHRSAIRRARAAHTLGLCHVGAALPLLLEALGDPSPEVRVAATRALGLLGEPTAAPQLLAAVGADRAVPASPAADALEGMGIGISGALREGLGAASPTTRAVAAYLSGEGSFTRSTPVLREVLATDPDPTVREAAAAALGRVGRAEDVAVLLRHTAADQPLTLRRAAAAALGELGDPSAADGLAALVGDPDPRLAELAAESLLCLGGRGRAALAAQPPSRAAEAALLVARLRGSA
jgi:HEAT repeat protein